MCAWFLKGIPFLPTAAPDPLRNKNCISLLTQCSDPMQTLAARRGTVGSVGRSLAHSLSTDTAYADWGRKTRRGGGEKKKKRLIRQCCYRVQARYFSEMYKAALWRNHVSNKLATLFPPPETCVHACTCKNTRFSPHSEETCQRTSPGWALYKKQFSSAINVLVILTLPSQFTRILL